MIAATAAIIIGSSVFTTLAVAATILGARRYEGRQN